MKDLSHTLDNLSFDDTHNSPSRETRDLISPTHTLRLAIDDLNPRYDSSSTIPSPSLHNDLHSSNSYQESNKFIQLPATVEEGMELLFSIVHFRSTQPTKSQNRVGNSEVLANSDTGLFGDLLRPHDFQGTLRNHDSDVTKLKRDKEAKETNIIADFDKWISKRAYLTMCFCLDIIDDRSVSVNYCMINFDCMIVYTIPENHNISYLALLTF